MINKQNERLQTQSYNTNKNMIILSVWIVFLREMLNGRKADLGVCLQMDYVCFISIQNKKRDSRWKRKKRTEKAAAF